MVVSTKDMEDIIPDLADIHLDYKSVDTNIMNEILSLEEINKLWSGNMNSTLRDEEITTLYWQHRL